MTTKQKLMEAKGDELSRLLVEALEFVLNEITSCGDVNEKDSGDEAIYNAVTKALTKYKENNNE